MTSISLYGAYPNTDDDYAAPRFGHPKDRRPDLKQVQAGLAVTGDGGSRSNCQDLWIKIFCVGLAGTLQGGGRRERLWVAALANRAARLRTGSRQSGVGVLNADAGQ